MTVSEVKEALGLEVLNMADGGREINRGYTGDLLSWVMGRAKQDNMWVTIMTNINVVAVAQLTDVACVVIAENAEVGEDVIARAEAQDINILRSEMTAWEVIAAASELL